MMLKRGETDADTRTMRNRIVLAAAASSVAIAAVVGVALGVGHDEPRLVRTAGVSAPFEESTTSTSLAPSAAAEKVAELDETSENHEARIRVLESTTTTAPAVQPGPTTTKPADPVVETEPTMTSTVPPTTVQPAPTTTTTFYGEPWWCTVPVEGTGRSNKVPCDSTTTTTAPVG